LSTRRFGERRPGAAYRHIGDALGGRCRAFGGGVFWETGAVGERGPELSFGTYATS